MPTTLFIQHQRTTGCLLILGLVTAVTILALCMGGPGGALHAYGAHQGLIQEAVSVASVKANLCNNDITSCQLRAASRAGSAVPVE